MSKQQNSTGLRVQVFAGALAAITAALIGSTLGVAGTVLGAGIASVLTTSGAALYQRMHARVARSDRPWAPVLAGGVLAFLLGMLVITGLELARGKQFSGGHGTTIGGIVRPGSGSGPSTEVDPDRPSTTPTVTTSPAPSSTTVETTPTPPPSSGVTTSPPTTTTPPATTTTTAQPPPSETG